MLLQWLACVVAVLVISPQTWIGRTPLCQSQHLWFAIFGGGVF